MGANCCGVTGLVFVRGGGLDESSCRALSGHINTQRGWNTALNELAQPITEQLCLSETPQHTHGLFVCVCVCFESLKCSALLDSS